jgi:zinc transport system substrate-binding protein
MLNKILKVTFLIWLWIFCNSDLSIADLKIPVFASILPQKYFLEQIGGDRVTVSVMVPPGASPHTYEPKPRQMADIATARIYFALGVSFENVWLQRITATNPKMLVVQTDEGINKIPMDTVYTFHDTDSQKGKNHETGDAHDHTGLDPHIWLSPPLVKIQAHHILAALIQVDPAHKNIYQQNFERFIQEIDQLDRYVRAIFAGKAGLRFMVFHPSWGYFAQTYGLKQIPVEIEGKTPKPAQLKDLINYANALKIKAIFVQPQFSMKSAQIIAQAIGGDVVSADPLSPDWANNLRKHSELLRDALK